MQLSQMQQWLAQRRDQGLYRQEQLLQPLPDGLLGFDGQTLLNFSGNDYLGLASAPSLRQAFADAASSVGSAATGSPLVTGFQPAHAELCSVLCDWLGVEAVLLFSSGFAANQAMLSALVAPDELLLLDKYCHASMQDVLMHGQLRFKRFPHQDFQALGQLLVKAQDKAVVVATEGVFSMDGDITDSHALLSLLSPQQPLLLDDAHGIGVLGEEGRGSWQHSGATATQLQCLMANFGKALAGQGGFLAGSRDVIDYIRQQSRHYIYSTALSPALCLAMVHSIDLCRREQWRRDKLAENIGLFRSGAAAAGLPLTASVTAIQPLLCQDNTTAMLWSQALKQAGIWLHAIRPPTVPQARLRICLSAAHSPAQIAVLISALVQTRPVIVGSN
ncbi:8-amino-7-oxononanoate synthase [Rheinheimera texasensis]|uniref:aminotransferase class I/II-fold pyridoxal phosphate-dependent enzyme n=1 Tax=Rheinheimera texasensis TaxID=306205 RepID=UPI0032B28F12